AHLEDADLVGGPEAVLGAAQDAERVAALAFEGEDGVDHMLDDPRPGMGPSLVTWPTSTTATPRVLASRTSSPAAASTWVTEPGPDSCASLHSVWMESITTRSKGSRFSPSAMARSE